MTFRSQNGWPAFKDPAAAGCVRFPAGGRNWWGATRDVATVLAEAINRFDVEVEPVIQTGEVLDDWSHAFRLVRGSETQMSNHASATAVDVNATRHPRGKRNTFSPKQQKAFRAIRATITDDSGRPVLRLGMDYFGTVDDMHIEINANAKQVAQAARKIREKHEQEEAAMALSKDDVERIWQEKVITVTPAAAAGIGSKDVKAGDLVSAQYLMQWGPLDRKLGREDAERDTADATRDAGLRAKVDQMAAALTTMAGQMTTMAASVQALTEANRAMQERTESAATVRPASQ